MRKKRQASIPVRQLYFTGAAVRKARRRRNDLNRCYLCKRHGGAPSLVYVEYAGLAEEIPRITPLTVKLVAMDVGDVKVNFTICLECASLFYAFKEQPKELLITKYLM